MRYSAMIDNSIKRRDENLMAYENEDAVTVLPFSGSRGDYGEKLYLQTIQLLGTRSVLGMPPICLSERFQAQHSVCSGLAAVHGYDLRAPGFVVLPNPALRASARRFSDTAGAAIG